MAKTSKAQIRASNKYIKLHTTSYNLRLNKEIDADVIQKLQEVDNKRKYIMDLIRANIGESAVNNKS